MSKLLDLLEWRTVSDASGYLSTQLKEEVTEADVLRLALDMRLRLSVNFVNGAKARCGYISNELSRRIHEEDYELPSIAYIFYDDNWDAAPLDPVSTIFGIYDLPMKYGERRDIESRYNALIGGPHVNFSSSESTIVEGQDSEICEIQMECAGQESSATTSYAKANCLPKDGMLVVRTEALKEFVKTYLTEPVTKLPETARQRRQRIKNYIDSAPIKARAIEELAKAEVCGVENIKRIYYNKDSPR